MNREIHLAITRMLLETAETLAENQPTALAAGELTYSAMFHACCAADRHPDEPHRQPQTRRELREIVNRLPVDRSIRTDCLYGIDSAVRRLHDNFYSAELSDYQLIDDLEIGTKLVRRLLQTAIEV